MAFLNRLLQGLWPLGSTAIPAGSPKPRRRQPTRGGGSRPAQPSGRRRPQPSPGPSPRRPGRAAGAQGRGGTVMAYHGTLCVQNVQSILKQGWLVGSGNALGDGIYFATDVSTAKSYAKASGVYVRCRIALGQTCHWDTAMQQRYAAWCRTKGVRSDNSAITAFLLQHGYDTVQQGTVVVVLAPQYANPTAWKRRHGRIRILSVHRAADDRRIRV